LNSWTGGFVATVRVTAGSTPLNGWRVTAVLPSGASVSNTWGASVHADRRPQDFLKTRGPEAHRQAFMKKSCRSAESGGEMIRRLTKAAVALCAAVGLAVVATPGTAAAADQGYLWGCWKFPSSVTNGGCVMFYAYGEVLRVEDFTPDGWGTRGQIQKLLPDSNGVLHWVNHSTNCFDDTSTSNTAGGMTVCNYSIGEGVRVRVHVWASRNGATGYHVYTDSIPA
jgi:hypothetical protein